MADATQVVDGIGKESTVPAMRLLLWFAVNVVVGTADDVVRLPLLHLFLHSPVLLALLTLSLLLPFPLLLRTAHCLPSRDIQRSPRGRKESKRTENPTEEEKWKVRK